MYLYKFQLQNFKGEWGGEIVSSQLGIKLTNVLFAYKFHCIASNFGETEHISPAITIDKIGLTLNLDA